jgi:hypothetical protein
VKYAVGPRQTLERPGLIEVAQHRRHAQRSQSCRARRTADQGKKFRLAAVTAHQPLAHIATANNQDSFHIR